MQAHRRRDILDQAWKILKPLLPWDKGNMGCPPKDSRLFINAVFLILRKDATWCDLPSPKLWRLENYSPKFLLLARQRYLGKTF